MGLQPAPNHQHPWQKRSFLNPPLEPYNMLSAPVELMVIIAWWVASMIAIAKMRTKDCKKCWGYSGREKSTTLGQRVGTCIPAPSHNLMPPQLPQRMPPRSHTQHHLLTQPLRNSSNNSASCHPSTDPKSPNSKLTVLKPVGLQRLPVQQPLSHPPLDVRRPSTHPLSGERSLRKSNLNLRIH